MSSVQKFHRRTLAVGGAVTWPPTAIGGGDAAHGFWLGDGYFNALVIAPKSTEVTRTWGSYGITRGTTSTTNGVANTNTLFGFGSAAHPAAYYAKSLTTGGYNTWYLPAKDELTTLYSNNTAVPFATADAFLSNNYWSSTESGGGAARALDLLSGSGGQYAYGKNDGPYRVRPIRRVGFATTVGQGNATSGYWLGTAGDGASKLIAAPNSTEVQLAWGSEGTSRSTTSTTNGVANTTTLFGFGSAAHPAAYYAKSLTTGGYNTWYLPAKNELNTLFSNKAAVPFATANAFVGGYYWSSTQVSGTYAWYQQMESGTQNQIYKSFSRYVRAVRRV
jgi:hypothetical protein